MPGAGATSNTSAGFFAELPVLANERDTFEPESLRPAPADWALAVTDIVDSTGAIASGRHKTVNFGAAMGIAGLRYGLHLSDTALMTCLVTSPADSLHVHFVDGGGGGYTSASRSLKGLQP